MKIRELLTDESKWTHTVEARNEKGDPCWECSTEACSFCLIGAAIRCYGALALKQLARIASKIKRHGKPKVHDVYSIVARWNDAKERTFADVRKLVEELDI